MIGSTGGEEVPVRHVMHEHGLTSLPLPPSLPVLASPAHHSLEQPLHQLGLGARHLGASTRQLRLQLSDLTPY